MRVLVPLLLLSSTACIAVRDGTPSSKLADDEQVQVFANAPFQTGRQRFTAYLDSVAASMDSVYALPTPEAKVQAVTSSGVYTTLRYLQTLYWLYSSKYEQLEVLQEESKKLEDFVSHKGDLDNFLSIAQASGNAEAIAHAKARHEEGKAAFLAYATTSRWFIPRPNMIDDMIAVLDAIPWEPIAADRNYLLNRIAKKLKSQHEKVYDFNLIEDGMHEFRRDARRPSYLNEAAGLILKFDRPGACPLLTIAQFDALPTESQQNVVPNVIPEPVEAATTDYYCHLSPCLAQKWNSISQQMASLKTQGASYEAGGQPVPATITDAARAQHAEMTKSLSQMFGWAQIKGCRTPEQPQPQPQPEPAP